jgi:hypothetical protein
MTADMMTRCSKRKKVSINTNERFVDIKRIRAGQEEQQRRLALSKSRDLAAEARKAADRALKIGQ